jgi:hypothetical protein
VPVGLQRDATPEQLAPRQGGGVDDRLVDVQRVVTWGRFIDEAANPADDVIRSIAVRDDIAEGLPDLAQVRRLGAKCGLDAAPAALSAAGALFSFFL